jgi:branched-chain amino acid transport system ATP-binding protein
MLTIDHITVRYGPIEALRGVSLTVEQGEIVAVIGANGAGKSTLLSAISGLMRVSSGTIEFDGRQITHDSPDARVKRGIAHVPQGRRVFGQMSVLQNLKIGAYTRTDAKGIQEDIAFFTDMFPILGQRLSQPAGTLSGGEQQMLAICRGLMSKPKLVLLDEPSMGISPKLVRMTFETIKQLCARLDLSVLLAEQNVNEALRIANRGYVLETGEVVLDGTVDYLRNHPRVLEAYLGLERVDESGEPVCAESGPSAGPAQ